MDFEYSAKVKDLQYFQGGDPDITPDPAIDLSLLSSSILELYNAFRRPIVDWRWNTATLLEFSWRPAHGAISQKAEARKRRSTLSSRRATRAVEEPAGEA